MVGAAFLAPAFLAGAFLAAAFFVPVLLAAVFLAFAFLAGAFLLAALLPAEGPAARRSARSSEARSTVSASTSSPRRNDALVVPSVTYGPNRPSLTTMVRPVAGSLPISRNGPLAVRLPRDLGWANRASASSTPTVRIWSSVSRLRVSLPIFR